MAELKCAIFDLDGTLFDSSSLWEDIDRRFLSERGIIMPDGFIDTLNTMSFSEAALYTKNLFSLKESPEELIDIWNEMARMAYYHEIPLKKGAAEYVRNVCESGIAIAAATDLERELAEACLGRNGILSFFSFISTTAECGKDKSFPDVYLRCAEHFGLESGRCIVYEDIIKGIRTAKAAGFRTVAVYDSASASSWGEMKAEADSFIASFS